MDISKFASSPTTKIKIKDPFGKATDIKVVVYGADSAVYRNARLAISRMEKTEDAQEIAKRGAKQISDCIASWANLSYDGKELKPQSVKAIEMLADPAFAWFTDQILLAIHDRKLFFSELASN